MSLRLKLFDRPIAHRGFHQLGSRPENSLSAFEAAVERGFPIELDVRLSKDKKVIVFHDEHLGRMAGLQGKVNDCEWSQMKHLFLNNSDQKIPLIEEVFDLVKGKVPLVIEVKSPLFNGEIESRLITKLKNYQGDVAIQSFNPLSLLWLRAYLKNQFPLGLLSTRFADSRLSLLRRTYLRYLFLAPLSWPNYIGLDYSQLDPVQEMVARTFCGDNIVYWTIKDSLIARRLLANGKPIIFEGFNPDEL